MQQLGKARKQLLDEINITPLTDVFLVLLIIMMVVAPMLKMSRSDIQMPQVDGGSAITEARLVIEVTKDGAMFIDGARTKEEDLQNVLDEKAKKYNKPDVVLRADRQTKAEKILAIYDCANKLQVESLTMAVETLPPDRVKELEQKPQNAGTPQP